LGAVETSIGPAVLKTLNPHAASVLWVEDRATSAESVPLPATGKASLFYPHTPALGKETEASKTALAVTLGFARDRICELNPE